MTLRRFRIGFLVTSVGVSTCTGGIFAIPLAFANEAIGMNAEENMSMASIDLYTCLTYSPIHEEHTEHAEDDGGCHDM
jgi:hypothetical protein